MNSLKPENCLILVVDDVSENLQLIALILEKRGYETTFATSGQQALERVQTAKPDLVLLDFMMPEMNGMEVCEKLKANPDVADIPIIFITASHEQEHLIQAFEKGAVDYITKPFKTPELLARVRTHLELRYTRDQLKKSLADQAKLTKNLERLANTDPLTGVWNRRYLLTLCEQEINRAYRYKRLFSLLMLDLDHFKQINDIYGHAVGDEVLIAMTKVVQYCLREVDFWGRFGGEEFVVILPETNLDAAVDVAERIRQNLEKTAISVEGEQVKITVSIGVSSYQLDDQKIDVVLQRADKALYEAKNQGRNRIALFGT
ncbi:diguanylate cyclase [Argonema antarcticum]|uniref:diguanylate cyclase n=1 Tax=Argonema antarcticum TaxID=2942763 RepID=UPI002011B1C4|nr:PleD family two-component system response regulator [Argonema antarcticum]MCL1471752.1 PleD family two-component system response regulator [Argonema antarcticum A004/B2]